MNKHRAWLADIAKKKAMLNKPVAGVPPPPRTRSAKVCRLHALAAHGRAARRSDGARGHPARGAAAVQGRRAAAAAAAAAGRQVRAAAAAAAAARAPKAAAAAAPKKPAWAMTEAEADEFEDDEADLLVEFAKDLDYDAYIDDLEVRQALSVIRERIDAGKAAEAAAAAVDEAARRSPPRAATGARSFSQSGTATRRPTARRSRAATARARRVRDRGGGGGGRRRRRAARLGLVDQRGRPDQAPVPLETSRAMAEEMLRENPELAQKHSVRSLAAVVEKQQGGGAPTKQRWVPPEHGITEEELPPLRVVTVIENPRVPTKDVDLEPALPAPQPRRMSGGGRRMRMAVERGRGRSATSWAGSRPPPRRGRRSEAMREEEDTGAASRAGCRPTSAPRVDGEDDTVARRAAVGVACTRQRGYETELG